MKKSTTRRQRVLGLLSILALSCSLGGAADAAPVSVVTESAGSFFADVATDGSSVYIAAGNRVMAAPAAGGAASTLYLGSSYAQAGSTNILSITTSGGNLFWGDAQSGPVTDSQILRASAVGGGPITAIYTGASVGQPIVDITGIDTDGTRLYTADAFGGRVHSLNLNGSGLVQIGPGRHPGGFGDARLNAITFAAGQLFVAQSTVKTSSSPTQFPALFVPKIQQHDAAVTTGSWIDLATGAALFGDGPLGITFGGGSLFVTQAASILEFDLTGTLLQTITDPLFTSLRGLTYDNGDLLVVDNTTAGGRVLRVDLAAAVPEPGTLVLVVSACILVWLAQYRRTDSNRSGSWPLSTMITFRSSDLPIGLRMPLLFLFLVGLATGASDAQSQTNPKPVTLRQVTTGPTDHRWPAVNSEGDVVWSERDSAGRWQVMRQVNGSNSPVQVTQTTTQFSFFQYPSIDSSRNVLVAAWAPASAQYWLLLYRDGQTAPETIEFSTTDPFSGAHRDVGPYATLSQDGTAIWYYDFFDRFGGVTRRLNISGLGRLGGDFTGFDFPAINSQSLASGNRQTLLRGGGNTLWLGTAGAATFPIGSPIVNFATRGRLNDLGDVVTTNNSGEVAIYFPPDYALTSTPRRIQLWTSVSGGWADTAYDPTRRVRYVVLDDQDENGNWQVYIQRLVQGVDSLQMPSARQWTEIQPVFDPKFFVVPSWGGRRIHRLPQGGSFYAQQALSATPPGILKAAYCLLNYNNRSTESDAPEWQDGGWQIKKCVEGVGDQVDHLKFIAIDVELRNTLSTDPDQDITVPTITSFEAKQRTCEAVQAVYDEGLNPVVYTGWRTWNYPEFGNTSAFSELPLWRADEVNLADHGNNYNIVRNRQDLAFRAQTCRPGAACTSAFGGWLVLSGRQYAADFTFPGTSVGVDLNIIDPDVLFRSFVQPPAEVDVTSQVAINPSGLTWPRQPPGQPRKAFGQVLITNRSSDAISGPLQLVFTSVGNMAPWNFSGLTSGHHPYLCVPLEAGGLPPGATVSVPVSFRVPAGVSGRPAFAFQVFSGYFSTPAH